MWYSGAPVFLLNQRGTNRRQYFIEQECIPVGCVPPACQTLFCGITCPVGVPTHPMDRQTPVKTLPSRNFVCGR